MANQGSLACLRIFKESEGVVAWWVTWLQMLDFKIVHTPGKHHSHDDELSCQASWLCRRNTCPEYAPLLHQVTPKKDMMRAMMPLYPYVDHFDGYTELLQDVSSLFHDSPTPVLHWVITLKIMKDPVARHMLYRICPACFATEALTVYPSW